MRALISRRRKELSGSTAALGLALSLAIAAPANARGLVADDPGPTSITGCAIAAGCAAQSAFAGTVFSDVYVYADGAISIGNPLANPTAGDLSTFGNSYIAAGLADYAALGFNMDVSYKINDTFSGPQLELYWIFHSSDPSGTLDGQDAMFGIYLTNTAPNQLNAIVGSGMAGFTWFHPPAYDAYCDLTCVDVVDNIDPNSAIYGVYLPDGALLGSSYTGKRLDTNELGDTTSSSSYDGSPVTVNSDYTYPNFEYDFTDPLQGSTSVPEPASWSMMAFGLLSLGALARRSRKRARHG